MSKCKGIVLNKPFEGSYTREEGKIAHEIVDFFLTDNGEQYAYNNPYGQFPNKDDCEYEYMLLCSSAKIKRGDKNKKEESSSTFKLRYLLKIEKVLHNYGACDDKEISFLDKQKTVKKIIDERNISYGGKKLYEIYGSSDESLYVTFKVKEMYEPKNGVIEVTTPGYAFQRNKGYVTENTHKEAFEALKNKIEDNSLWKKCSLNKLDKNSGGRVKIEKTFLDFILKNDSEECFTNMLCSMLGYNDVFNNFVKKFNKSKIPFNNVKYDVKREVKIDKTSEIKGGRTDICAQESGNENGQRIVIENKVFSGLNGLDDNGKTQLTVYYENWAIKNINPICFLTCPDFRVSEIKSEIEQGMEGKYQFVSYSEIAEFLEGQNFSNYPFKKYVKDAISAFKNYGYKNKFELFEELFLEAID